MNSIRAIRMKEELDRVEKEGDGDFAPTWEPEPGQEVMGEVQQIREVEARYGKTRVMQLKREDGTLLDIFMSPAVLARKLNNVQIGAYVGVRYLGDAKSKAGNTYGNYAVAIEEPVKPAVPSLPPGMPRIVDFND